MVWEECKCFVQRPSTIWSMPYAPVLMQDLPRLNTSLRSARQARVLWHASLTELPLESHVALLVLAVFLHPFPLLEHLLIVESVGAKIPLRHVRCCLGLARQNLAMQTFPPGQLCYFTRPQ